MLRKILFGLIAASVVGFGASFIAVAGNNETGAWGGGLTASIVVFVVSIVCLQFAGQGMGRAVGPTSFAELDAGTSAAPPPGDRPTRRPRTWTRTWLNIYFWTGAGELFLGTLFVIAGAMSGGSDALGGGLAMFGILGGIGAIFLYCAYRTAAKNRLHETGLEGRGTIMGIRQTGMWLNNNPVSVLDLRIQLDGHPSYEVRHRETVPQVLLGRLTNGQTLPVRVNPHKPSDFIIEWEQA
jgi:hypothetical protein